MINNEFQKITIVLLGNIASGKTSVVKLLKKNFEADFIMADNLFQTKNPYRELYLKEMRTWAFKNETWMTMNRATLIDGLIKKSTHTRVFIDSGLPMSWVYAYSHFQNKVFTRLDWKLYQQIFTRCSMLTPGKFKVIYLDYKLPTLLKRLNKRGRAYELNYYNQTYLQQIRLGLQKLIANFKRQKIEILTIKEKEFGDFLLTPNKQAQFIKQVRLFIKAT